MSQNLKAAFRKGALYYSLGKKKGECPYPKGSASHEQFCKGYDQWRVEKLKGEKK